MVLYITLFKTYLYEKENVVKQNQFTNLSQEILRTGELQEQVVPCDERCDIRTRSLYQVME
jgi:hypothetical protein